MAAIPFQPMMESRPIREIAYEVLKHAIITGEIPAGERIVETEYADRIVTLIDGRIVSNVENQVKAEIDAAPYIE